MTTIGLLKPGELGSAGGASARTDGARGLWAPEGRGGETRRRAEAAGLEDVRTLAELARRSDVILCVCPPHAAVDVARAVAAERFAGLYVDGNAVSPATAREIGGIVEKAGAPLVDRRLIRRPPADRRAPRPHPPPGPPPR